MKFKNLSDTNHMAEISDRDAKELALIASKYVLLPNPDVIKQLGAVAYFPTARRSEQTQRVNTKHKSESGEDIIVDKNGSPGWALLWPHGLREKPTGWRLAHVWDGYAKDPDAFSNPANLCLISGALMSLTDIGKGYTPPLMPYLKYHAYEEYKWRPTGQPKVEKPKDYKYVAESWKYLPTNDDPREMLRHRFNNLGNEKVTAIKSLNTQIPWRTK